jgi:hypothetical protein
MERTIIMGSNYQQSFDNYYSLLRYYFIKGKPSTYYKDDLSLQCNEGKRRSFSDLLLLVKGYFNDVKVENVVKVLSLLLIERVTDVIFCRDIKKWVFNGSNQGDINSFILQAYTSRPGYANDFTKYLKDYYISIEVKGVDGWSLKDILDFTDFEQQLYKKCRIIHNYE